MLLSPVFPLPSTGRPPAAPLPSVSLPGGQGERNALCSSALPANPRIRGTHTFHVQRLLKPWPRPTPNAISAHSKLPPATALSQQPCFPHFMCQSFLFTDHLSLSGPFLSSCSSRLGPRAPWSACSPPCQSRPPWSTWRGPHQGQDRAGSRGRASSSSRGAVQTWTAAAACLRRRCGLGSWCWFGQGSRWVWGRVRVWRYMEKSRKPYQAWGEGFGAGCGVKGGVQGGHAS